jgi:hypothetical protein
MVEVEVLEDSAGPTRASTTALLETIASSLPPDQSEAFRSSVIPNLLQAWDNPPLHLLHKTNPEVTTVDAFRALLFAPSSGAPYAALLTMPFEGAKPNSAQITFLAMLYLNHIHSNGDFKFAASFIEAGGLTSLVSSFSHPNLHWRGQIIDSFLQLTSHTGFDWFAVLSLDDESKAKRRLHQCLLDLGSTGGTASPIFLTKLLVENSPSSSLTFPGGSFLSLQILGFWLSWVRALHTPKNALALSPAAVEQLAAWKDAPIWSGKGDIAGGEIMAEEKDLAAKLYDDFSKSAASFSGPDPASVSMSGHNTSVPDNFIGAKRLEVNELPDGKEEFVAVDGDEYVRASEASSRASEASSRASEASSRVSEASSRASEASSRVSEVSSRASEASSRCRQHLLLREQKEVAWEPLPLAHFARAKGRASSIGSAAASTILRSRKEAARRRRPLAEGGARNL